MLSTYREVPSCFAFILPREILGQRLFLFLKRITKVEKVNRTIVSVIMALKEPFFKERYFFVIVINDCRK